MMKEAFLATLAAFLSVGANTHDQLVKVFRYGGGSRIGTRLNPPHPLGQHELAALWTVTE